MTSPPFLCLSYNLKDENQLSALRLYITEQKKIILTLPNITKPTIFREFLETLKYQRIQHVFEELIFVEIFVKYTTLCSLKGFFLVCLHAGQLPSILFYISLSFKSTMM